MQINVVDEPLSLRWNRPAPRFRRPAPRPPAMDFFRKKYLTN
jgi:hypothetical protein